METFIIITGFEGVGGGRVPPEELWNISTGYIAYKNGDKYILEEGRIRTKGDDNEMKRLRKLLPLTSVIKISGTKKGNSIELNEVLETDIKDDVDANAIIEEYIKPVTFKDDILGEFTLDKSVDIFSGYMNHNGSKISVSLDDKEDIKTARELYQDIDKIVRDASAFAAEKLTDLSNDWGMDDWDEDDGEYVPVTEESFAKRIVLRTISISEEGEYTLWFDDDDMFWGHVVCVYGSIKDGFKDASIEG